MRTLAVGDGASLARSRGRLAHVPDRLLRRAQIREVKEWKQTKNVRLICSGRELFPGDLVCTAPGEVLHCIATEYVPPPQAQRKPPQLQVHPATPEDPPLDWVRRRPG
jgi:hypothetical protein